MIWSIIFASLASANPDDIENLGNSSNSSSQTDKKTSEKEKQKDSKTQAIEEERREERLEQEYLEEEQRREEYIEQEYLEEEQRRESLLHQQNQVNDQMFGTPDDLRHQEQLDPYLFESHTNESSARDPNAEDPNADQRWWKSFRRGNSEQSFDSNSASGLHQAVYDQNIQNNTNDQDKQDFEADQVSYEASIRQKYQQNLNQDEILFSSLQQNTSQINTEPTEELAPNFGSEYKGEQNPNIYKSGLTTYQAPQVDIKKSDGFNPYNSSDTFSVQANDGVDNMYRPENSKGFTVGLNHDFDNPYDVENLLNQNSTLQNGVRPASEVHIEDVPEIKYSSKTPNTGDTNIQIQGTNIDIQNTEDIAQGKPPQSRPEKYKPQITQETEVMSLPDISKEYRLGSGDSVTIYAWSGDFIERDISKNYIVADTGYIQIPIVGSVKIGNLTTSEAASLITDALGEYIKAPIVQLQLQMAQSQKVWLLGNISRPGVIFLEGPKTLIQALSERGFTRNKRGDGAWAETKIHVQREDGSVLLIDTESLLETGEGNIYLKGGDSIFITDGAYIYLNGKFKRSGPVPFREGMTVSDACAEAMGYDKEANLRKLYIYRKEEQIEVDLRAIFQGDAKDVVLKQGDRLYLEESIW